MVITNSMRTHWAALTSWSRRTQILLYLKRYIGQSAKHAYRQFCGSRGRPMGLYFFCAHQTSVQHGVFRIRLSAVVHRSLAR